MMLMRTRCFSRRQNAVTRILRLVLLLIVAVQLGLMISFADPAFAARTKVPRTVLALFDSTQEGKADRTRIHRYAEMVLNHLGYHLEYVDISAGLPLLSDVPEQSRVITWFDEPVADAGTYLDWVVGMVESGARFAIMEHPGIERSRRTGTQHDQLFALFGLQVEGMTSMTFDSKVRFVDRAMYAFEHRLDPILPGYPNIRIIDPDVTAHLMIAPSGEPDARMGSAIVTTGPHGGFVPSGFALFEERDIQRVKWLVNPFAFFEASFSDGLRPIPDVATLSGKRIFFSHIDGDGWNNISDVKGANGENLIAARVALDRIIAPRPGIPVTVGLVAGDVDTELGGNAQSREVARQLYSLPQVEVASHGYTHPYNWQYYEKYDRVAEQSALLSYQDQASSKPYQKIGNMVVDGLGLEAYFTPVIRQVSGDATLPRTYLKEPFSLRHEIRDSLVVAESLAPLGKKAALYQWSGDAEPFADAVRMTRQVPVENINGGDSRFDRLFPSHAYVAPIARPVGSERQIYAANSNEYAYTNRWTGPFHGQILVLETVERTGAPRRLKPFNLYYHIYSAEKVASLTAIEQLLDYGGEGEFIAIRASHYARIADSFFDADIIQTGSLQWSVSNRGALQTVRFDDADELSVDMGDSDGVLGYTRFHTSLYVALDGAVPEARISLFRTKKRGNLRRSAYLVESNRSISNLQRGDCKWSFDSQGFGAGEMIWMVPQSGTFQIVAQGQETGIWTENIISEENKLRVTLPDLGSQSVQFQFKCRGSSDAQTWIE